MAVGTWFLVAQTVQTSAILEKCSGIWHCAFLLDGSWSMFASSKASSHLEKSVLVNAAFL